MPYNYILDFMQLIFKRGMFHCQVWLPESSPKMKLDSSPWFSRNVSTLPARLGWSQMTRLTTAGAPSGTHTPRERISGAQSLIACLNPTVSQKNTPLTRHSCRETIRWHPTRPGCCDTKKVAAPPSLGVHPHRWLESGLMHACGRNGHPQRAELWYALLGKNAGCRILQFWFFSLMFFDRVDQHS